MATSDAEVAPTGAVAESAPTPPAAVAAVPEPEAVPATAAEPEFDWDAWDLSPDSLPEAHREVGSKIVGRFSPKLGEYDEIRPKYEQLQGWFDALDAGREDPRLAEYQGKATEWEGKHGALQSEYEQYKARVEAEQAAQVEAWAEKFFAAHQEFLAVPENKSAYAALIQQDWDPEVAMEIAKLGPAASAVAQEAKSAGAPDKIAVRLARAEAAATAPAPAPAATKRHAAEVVAGNGPGAQSGPAAHLSTNDGRTSTERARYAAEAAFRKHHLRAV